LHPQAKIHSIVEFLDNSQLALLAVSDMKLPIQQALSKFDNNHQNVVNSLSLKEISLSFKEMDISVSPLK